MIVGTQVVLRPARAADLPLLRQWEADPAVAHWLGTSASALESRESAEQEYDRLLRTPRVRLLAIQTAAGAVIGFVRLNDLDQQARKVTLRLLVAPEQQSQGYGTAALRLLARFCFAELGLHRLGLVVRADNQRAIGVYRRLGFVEEGRERDALWSAGGWVDWLYMGLLAGELTDGEATA